MWFLSRIFWKSHDGSSFERAIVVEGVGEEYDWIRTHYPDYEPVMQILSEVDGKPYDVQTIRNEKGHEKKLCFDISRFYGQFRKN